MHELLDLENFPINHPHSEKYKCLVTRCREELSSTGMFNLDRFVKPESADNAATELTEAFSHRSFTHSREHNIYFKNSIDDLPKNHPALQSAQTRNQTLCADQLHNNLVTTLYEWAPLRSFLAEVLQKPALYLMDDPLARVNVMRYGNGDALGWHFDRAEFTTTLLLQSPDAGGTFEYRLNLRDEQNPNYEGVANLLRGNDPLIRSIKLQPGTLNVFRGRNTAHRVTATGDGKPRVIAVFSFFETPGVTFSPAEQRGFYGRSAP